MTIHAAIHQVRQRYIHEGKAALFYDINDGQCDSFAADVLELLGENAGELREYCAENFMTGFDGDPYESDVWDWELLEGWGIRPPAGMTHQDVNEIAFGGHVWLSDGRLHYDAECPQGVSSFFDLPLYRRCLVPELRCRGFAADDVVTDDERPAPACPVPNPVLANRP